MDDLEARRRALRAARYPEPSWAPMPAGELAAELARSHPHYAVERLLGHGGMGAVYLAEDRRDASRVAIKTLRHDELDAPAYVERFAREVDCLRRLSQPTPHPNVVRFLDAGETLDGYRFFSMELLAGRSLAGVLAGPARLPLRRVVSIMADLCAGAQHAHDRGLVHRDLKAGNVFLVDADGRAVILDWGVAGAAAAASTLSRLYGTPGTPGHVAPELLRESPAAATPAADVFSLGVIFVHLLTGEVPDASRQLPSAYGLDPRLDAVVEKALWREPEGRFSSAGELAAAIDAAMRPAPTAIASPIGSTKGAAPSLAGPVMPLDEDDPSAAAGARESTKHADVPPDGSGGSAGATRRTIRFPVQDEIVRLQGLLRSVSSVNGDGWVMRRSAPSWSPGLTLSSVVDASQEAPRTPPLRRAAPKLVTWDPAGRAVVTACGAWGCTYWDVRDNGLSRRWHYHPESCYGEPGGVTWSLDGRRFLLNGYTGRSSYAEIYETSPGHSADLPPRRTVERWFYESSFYLRDLLSWDVEPFTAWRPGLPELLVGRDRALVLVDTQLIPMLAPAADEPRSFLLGVALNVVRALGRLASPPPPTKVERSSSREGLARGERSSLDLAPLGSLDSWVRGSSWHPSGQFLALTTEAETAGAETRRVQTVRILHFESALVVATLSGARAFGWSPGGGLLLLDSGAVPAGASASSRFTVWDVSRAASRPLTPAESASPAFARTIASVSHSAAANAAGELILRPDGGGHRILRIADGVELGRLPSAVADAAWSPSDPGLLATVGGKDAPASLRLWRVG